MVEIIDKEEGHTTGQASGKPRHRRENLATAGSVAHFSQK